MQIALAPMEGLVDNILRDVLTRVGGIDWCVTEFIRVNEALRRTHRFEPALKQLCLFLTPSQQSSVRGIRPEPLHLTEFVGDLRVLLGAQ